VSTLLRSEAYVREDRTFETRFWQYLTDIGNSANSGTEEIADIIDRLDLFGSVIAVIQADVDALKETFSWKVIPASETITIAETQQMVVSSGITIDGDLILEGDLALI